MCRRRRGTFRGPTRSTVIPSERLCENIPQIGWCLLDKTPTFQYADDADDADCRGLTPIRDNPPHPLQSASKIVGAFWRASSLARGSVFVSSYPSVRRALFSGIAVFKPFGQRKGMEEKNGTTERRNDRTEGTRTDADTSATGRGHCDWRQRVLAILERHSLLLKRPLWTFLMASRAALISE
jgi:hypothetical protein